jgi:DNA-directed RNA polymerase subunit alpha
MIPLPNAPKITKEEENKATFEIEALWPGYGVTLGNALRRVLLSSLEGTAITQVKIKGVSHEFTVIDGVMEDVIQIVLNLKKLRFKMIGDEPQTATLKVKGEKEVTGADFDLPTQLEIVNKDCHIATLTEKNASLEMEVKVEKGVGYLAKERMTKKKTPIGTILVDAIFTPVKKVAMKVENMRVGERTDFDRLFLEIETDGTITPKEALLKAVDILLNHYNFLKESLSEKEKK